MKEINAGNGISSYSKSPNKHSLPGVINQCFQLMVLFDCYRIIRCLTARIISCGLFQPELDHLVVQFLPGIVDHLLDLVGDGKPSRFKPLAYLAHFSLPTNRPSVTSAVFTRNFLSHSNRTGYALINSRPLTFIVVLLPATVCFALRASVHWVHARLRCPRVRILYLLHVSSGIRRLLRRLWHGRCLPCPDA